MSEARVAVVTGSNRGIGLEIARELAAKGYRVIAAARTQDEAAQAARAIGGEPATLDVTNAAHIAALAAQLSSGLDVLVNNAGIAMDGFNAKVARNTLDVNFFGALRVTQRLLPLVRTGGRVVMVSSQMGALSSLSPAVRERLLDPALGVPELEKLMESFVTDVAEGVHAKKGWPSSAYGVSKAGMNTLTRILARQLEKDPRKILVNSACPGWVNSRMGGPSAPRSTTKGAETPVWLATLPAAGPSGGFFQDRQPHAW